MSHARTALHSIDRPTARRPRPWTVVRATMALLATVGLLLLGSTAAVAHDTLESTTPEDGSTVATAPTQVVLAFSDDVVAVGTKIVISGPDGEVQQGRPRVDGTKVTQSMAPASAAGKYTVTWRATSKDGHPVSGTFTFTAKAAGASVPSRTAPTSTPVVSSPAAVTAGAGSTTGESGQGGTSWALWLAVGVVVLAGAAAVAVRSRRGHAGRRRG